MDAATTSSLIAILLMISTAFLLVAYLGADKVAKERQEEIKRLEKIGRSLYLYIKDDLTTGSTAFSFYGGRSSRAFEVWRNERLNREARPLIRQWEERHTYAGSNVEPTRPNPVAFDPSELDEVGKASMEWQPEPPLSVRALDPKKEGDWSDYEKDKEEPE